MSNKPDENRDERINSKHKLSRIILRVLVTSIFISIPFILIINMLIHEINHDRDLLMIVIGIFGCCVVIYCYIRGLYDILEEYRKKFNDS